MISKTYSCRVLFLSLLLPMTVMGAAYFFAPSPAAAQGKQATSAAGSTQQRRRRRHTRRARWNVVVTNPDSQSGTLANGLYL
jgi:hypothetical protein